jgi:hypothetical protein
MTTGVLVGVPVSDGVGVIVIKRYPCSASAVASGDSNTEPNGIVTAVAVGVRDALVGVCDAKGVCVTVWVLAVVGVCDAVAVSVADGVDVSGTVADGVGVVVVVSVAVYEAVGTVVTVGVSLFVAVDDAVGVVEGVAVSVGGTVGV